MLSWPSGRKFVQGRINSPCYRGCLRSANDDGLTSSETIPGVSEAGAFASLESIVDSLLRIIDCPNLAMTGLCDSLLCEIMFVQAMKPH
jgi:hypothetical protein